MCRSERKMYICMAGVTGRCIASIVSSLSTVYRHLPTNAITEALRS